MVRSEADRLTRVAVCTPRLEYALAQDLESQNFRERPDSRRAVRQHDGLKDVLRSAGAEVFDLPELQGHPNSVFTRDVALCTPEGYVQLRMGLPARRGEEAWMARALDGLGEPRVGAVRAPATAEGGDVILADDLAFVGHSRRTNEAGVRQLTRLLEPMGYRIRVAPVPEEYLHIGGAMSLIGPRLVLARSEVFPAGFFHGFDVVDVSGIGVHPSSGNVICVAAGEVIGDVSETAATLERLDSAGVTVHPVDLSELQKGSGGPTCLVLPVERLEST